MNAYWLSAMIGADAADIAIWSVFAVAVLSALIAAFIFFRRRRKNIFRKTVRRDNHRISVRDVIAVDSRRRLVLIRRDDMEHLLLTGGDSDVVIETFTGLPEEKEPAFEAARATQSASADAPHGEKHREPANAYMAKPQSAPYSGNMPAAHPARNSGGDISRPDTRGQESSPWQEEQERIRSRQSMQNTRPDSYGSGGSQESGRYNNSGQNGNPFPPYSPKDPQTHMRGGQNGNRDSFSPMSESYAPYLGYIPHSNANSAPQSAMPNSSSHGERAVSAAERQNNGHSSNNGSSVRAFETKQNDRPMRNNGGGQSSLNSGGRNARMAEEPSPPSQTGRPSFRNQNERNGNNNGFNGASRGNSNGFASVALPEENDFDKILQDELLRAPNGIKFPSSQKK